MDGRLLYGIAKNKMISFVFEVDLSVFQSEGSAMNNEEALKNDEQEAIAYGKRVEQFYEQLISYIAISLIFLFVFGVIHTSILF